MLLPIQGRAGKESHLKYYFYVLIFAMTLAGCKESIKHDEVLAGKQAEEFARITFVKQDMDSGYALLADATKRHVSRDQFKVVVLKLHPNGFPKTVAAFEYKPMPLGEKAIYVSLKGENSGEHFNYEFTMEGTATTGYRVLKFSRSSGRPLSSSN